ncbi:Endoribonuclease YbeY (modular protein) [Candidatus Sulfotelmatomonas gaucii]|uniref:Endoribonuclease YbeY n=1 Tax=Candidatus Sulfuritelmatomonas gaucii TaxID=2043161 RepID=A0A2N9L691_9BACT|nr:Endoribonuclease YbeY (modular protein) [Candidatus Sulfotelmatomonas gaucii]
MRAGADSILAPDRSRIIKSDSGHAISLALAARRAMILLDPDLDPDAESHSGATSPGSAWRRSALPWAERVPTPPTLSRYLKQAQDAVRLRGQVTVLLTTDENIRNLNRRFRGKNRSTDVLSFAPNPQVQNQEKVAGDIAISIPTARRLAVEQGHALTCELKILILHGLLHLAGYDHDTDHGKMRRRERQLRALLGLPLGLIERAQRSAGKKRSRKP